MLEFDMCDDGMPCSCTTTGCPKGQCYRRLNPMTRNNDGTVTIGVQACRPGDRAILQTDAGRELVTAAVAMMKDGAAAIAAERKRQTDQIGFDPAHDDAHEECELARAARSYLSYYVAEKLGCIKDYPETEPPGLVEWPWAEEWWKPKDSRSNLVRAGALIAAEIDRLDRRELTKED